MAKFESIRFFSPKSDCAFAASSNRRRISLPEPVAWTVSSPLRVSTKTLCLDILLFIAPSAMRAKKGWITRPDIITTGTAINGTKASGPAIKEITQMNRKMKGRSTIATKVAEVKNSRNVSNSRTILAIAPDF